MIYQPRNVQPSGVSIDGLLDNTFTMEIQTNSYVSAYQLLIVDFDNNEIYTGAKTTLAKYAYNGDTLEIPVSASAVALSNGTNYKWRVRLYQPTADMLITYGLVQATSTTTTIYLQPNINIKAGMAITINSQTKTISSYNSDTGVAVVSSAFSSAPAVGTQYKIYSDFIETVPDYIVYARRTPAVAISNVPSSLTLKYHTFQGTYIQSDNVPIVYHKFDLYTRNDDGIISLVASSDKVYSANLSYTYDSFRTGNKYLIQMTVENDMGIISTTDMYEFTVSYDIVEYLQQPSASFDDKNNAVKVSWVTPVEHDATSFRSDAATGAIQDNNNTLTQATFEPGQSIGEGDVVQLTNSDCNFIINGVTKQNVYSGKNLLNVPSEYSVIGSTLIDVNMPAGFYVINWEDIITDGTGTDMLIYFYYEDNTTLAKYISPTYTSKSLSFTTTKNINKVGIYSQGNYNDSQGITTTFKKLMISTNGGEYEPYVGGKPSPSPEYPQEIEVGRGKNLFNNKNPNYIVGATWQPTETGGKFSASTTLKWVGWNLKLNMNKQYTFSYGAHNSKNVYLYIYTYTDDTYTTIKTRIVIDGVNLKNTFKPDSEYVRIAFSNNAVIEDIEIPNIQLEKGSVATSYLPYNTIESKSTGKNLLKGLSTSLTDSKYWFDVNKYYFTPLEDGWGKFEYDNTNGTSTVFINAKVNLSAVALKENTTYTILTEIRNSNISENSGAFFQIVTSNPTVAFSEAKNLTYNSINAGGSFKTSLKTKESFNGINVAIDSCLRLSKGTKGTVEARITLVEGDYATKDFVYEPYQESSTQYHLGDNFLADKDYIENGVLNKSIGKVVLDGSENWGLWSTNVFYIPKLTEKINCSSTHFKFVTTPGASALNNGEFCITTSANNYCMLFKNTDYDNVTDFKAWLSENPVTVYYELATPKQIPLETTGDIVPKVNGLNYMNITMNLDSTFSLEYPYKTITGNTWGYTEFNPPGAKQTGTIKSYNAITGVGTLMPQYPFMYTPMQGDSYAVISNIYNVSGFSYLYNTPYNTVNSLYTHGYTATWATPDGLCVLPDDFNITLQFSPDGSFFYDQDGVYQEVVDLITTETDDPNNEGEFTIKIDKNKLIFVQNPDISLELPFYTNTTQVFVLSSANIAQINNDYIWDDTATWTDTYTWVEGGTSLERVCNHWWKVQITNTGIKIEEIFPTT